MYSLKYRSACGLFWQPSAQIVRKYIHQVRHTAVGLTSCPPPDALAVPVLRVRASLGAASATFLHAAADMLSCVHSALLRTTRVFAQSAPLCAGATCSWGSCKLLLARALSKSLGLHSKSILACGAPTW